MVLQKKKYIYISNNGCCGPNQVKLVTPTYIYIKTGFFLAGHLSAVKLQ